MVMQSWGARLVRSLTTFLKVAFNAWQTLARRPDRSDGLSMSPPAASVVVELFENGPAVLIDASEDPAF